MTDIWGVDRCSVLGSTFSRQASTHYSPHRTFSLDRTHAWRELSNNKIISSNGSDNFEFLKDLVSKKCIVMVKPASKVFLYFIAENCV